MYPIDLKELEEFLIRAKGYVKIMTIAPELKDADIAIKLLSKYGVIASAGHSYASYEDMIRGIAAGLNHATHTYNAMREFNHKNAGILEAVWLEDKIYAELIADGVHVSKQAIEVLIRLKGKQRVMAVSDGGYSCGIEYEEGHIFEDGHFIKNGAVFSADGITLCGSTRDLYKHFKFFINQMGYSIYEAAGMTSRNAAQHLGVNFGEIVMGSVANLIIIDKAYNIKTIIINGKIFSIN